MRQALAAILLAAPAAGDWLPLEPGTRWTYDVTAEASQAPAAPEDARQVVAEIKTPAVTSDDWTEVSNFLGYANCWLRTTESAVELRAESGADAPVLALLKLPARAGDSWKGALGPEEVAFTTGAEQTLEDGGRALRVDFQVTAAERHAGHAETRGSLWFRRGTGLVKASLTKDLDCHSASTTVWRLRPE